MKETSELVDEASPGIMQQRLEFKHIHARIKQQQKLKLTLTYVTEFMRQVIENGQGFN